MIHHQHFNLLLHTNGEIGAHLGGEVVVRTTLQEWPLSCVQRIMLYCGRRVIYKSQYGPTVEPEFHACAASSLLVKGDTLYHGDGHASMLFPFIEAPLLNTLNLGEEELVAVGQTLLADIAALRGKVPVWLDVSTVGRWRRAMNDMLDDLASLVQEGDFVQVDEETVAHLAEQARADHLLAALAEHPGLVHGDLAGDNVFVTREGYRIIDWQRPLRAPRGLDLATLLESSGHDPLPYVGRGIVDIMHLLRIYWLVQCARHWFTPGRTSYDQQIAALAGRINAY